MNDIAIIGGGAAGAAVFGELLRQHDRRGTVHWITGGPAPGRGVAYATDDDRHLLNVRAAGMGLFADQKDDFLQHASRSLGQAQGIDFLPRRLFGDFVQAQVQARMAEAQAHGVRFQLHHARARSVVRADDARYRIGLDAGDVVTVDAAVLAIGALAPRALRTVSAEALDSEMRERVESHRRQREGRFETLEEPLALSTALDRAAARHDVILVDCLTLWITNLLGAGHDVAKAVDELSATLAGLESSRVILVSNEVGLGIVPDNPLARTFRDLAGSAHQRIAEACDDVYFVMAGLPLTLKGAPPEQN